MAQSTDSSHSSASSQASDFYAEHDQLPEEFLEPSSTSVEDIDWHALLPKDTAQEDAVSILVDMVQHGKVDPWDIDVVAVADEYLKAVSSRKAPQVKVGGDDANLKTTGKLLLYLAILLRLKSDKLAGIDILFHQDDEAHLDDDFWEHDNEFDPMQLMAEGMFPKRELDELIERRTSTKARRIRKVTIQDLIRELQRYEKLEQETSVKRQLERQERARVKDYSKLTATQIESLAHDESIEDNVLRLKVLLENIFTSDMPKVGMDELMDSGQLDQISAYLALLFLAGRGHVALHQERFYEDIFVGPPEEAPPTDPEQDESAPKSSTKKSTKSKKPKNPKNETHTEKTKKTGSEEPEEIPSATEEATPS